MDVLSARIVILRVDVDVDRIWLKLHFGHGTRHHKWKHVLK